MGGDISGWADVRKLFSPTQPVGGELVIIDRFKTLLPWLMILAALTFVSVLGFARRPR